MIVVEKEIKICLTEFEAQRLFTELGDVILEDKPVLSKINDLVALFAEQVE